MCICFGRVNVNVYFPWPESRNGVIRGASVYSGEDGAAARRSLELWRIQVAHDSLCLEVGTLLHSLSASGFEVSSRKKMAMRETWAQHGHEKKVGGYESAH